MDSKTCLFSKIVNLNNSSSYITRSSNLNKIKGIRSRTEQFKYSFFPFSINERNKLDNMIKKSVNMKCFKSILMKFFSLQDRSLFSIHNSTDAKLLTRLSLKFSYLNKHKFRHNFKDTVVSMRDCGTETETTQQFFLRCPFFVTEKQKILNNVYDKHFSSQNLNGESSSMNKLVVTAFLNL